MSSGQIGSCMASQNFSIKTAVKFTNGLTGSGKIGMSLAGYISRPVIMVWVKQSIIFKATGAQLVEHLTRHGMGCFFYVFDFV